MEAEIILEYEDCKTARAIAEAVSPDNFKIPIGLFVKTVKRGRKVLTTVKCHDKMTMFIATIDDLLFCTSTAEKTLKATKLYERKNEGN